MNQEKVRVKMEDLDKEIRGLVEVLNRLLAIQTMSSCGGHENPTDSQVSEDEFYIELYKEPGFSWEEFLTSIRDILVAKDLCNEGNKISLSVWRNETNIEPHTSPDSLNFHLEGKNGVDPDSLAYHLREIIKGGKNGS